MNVKRLPTGVIDTRLDPLRTDAHGETIILFDNTLPFCVMRIASHRGNLSLGFVSESSRVVWGLSKETIGQDIGLLWSRIHADDRPRLDAVLSWAERAGTEWSATFRIVDDGGDRWAVARGLPLEEGPSGTWIVTVTDISAQIAAFNAVQSSERQLRALAESIPGAAFHSWEDADGNTVVNFMSRACEEIWELTAEEIRADVSRVWAQTHPQDLAVLKISIRQAGATATPWFHRWRIITPSGRKKWLEGRGRPERRHDGGIMWSGLILDISAQRRQERELRRLAEHDDRTGLANRAVLRRRLGEELALAAGGDSGALLLLDIDGFSEINDLLGHEGGDDYLRVFAERLVCLTSGTELAARIGGDEFALLLPRIGDAASLDAAMRRIGAGLADDLVLGGRVLPCGITMGAALFPRDGTTVDAVSRSASMALSEARQTGRGTRAVYTREMTEARARRSGLARSLRADIAQGRLDVAFQPIVATRDHRHAGFEALARWSLNGQEVSPVEFIPLAEETGLAVPLGLLLMRRALARAAALRKEGFAPGVISVNVSAGQIRDTGFVAAVDHLLAEFDHPPRELEIEVTETVILGRQADHIAATLRRLRRRGIRVALDDFGTGYASLAHLKEIRVDRLKIDRSFIQNVNDNPDDAVIVRAILGLAEALDLEVVAEGVETDRQLRFLAQQGCPCAQGYLFGRPTRDMDALRAYLAAPPHGHDAVPPAADGHLP